MTVLLVSEARKLHLGSRFFNTVCAIVKSYHANVMHVNARNDKADILFYNKNFQYGLQAMCSLGNKDKSLYQKSWLSYSTEKK